MQQCVWQLDGMQHAVRQQGAGLVLYSSSGHVAEAAVLLDCFVATTAVVLVAASRVQPVVLFMLEQQKTGYCQSVGSSVGFWWWLRHLALGLMLFLASFSCHSSC
jgi:hypothetical protein